MKRLDQLSLRDSPLHRLDPRAKVITTGFFLISVVSFGRYELSAMAPYFIFPAVLIAMGGLPLSYILKKVALVCPFALLVGIANPLFDRTPLLHFGSLVISGGWISCVSIVERAILTVSAAIILVAVTGVPAICRACDSLGMPKAFAMQLHFLYRYLFVLAEEGRQASRARELRSIGKKGLGMTSYSSLLGHLLMRTWQRAERMHMAMLGRGFSGAFATGDSRRFGAADACFVISWTTLFIVLRLNNIPQLFGSLLSRFLR